jgi:BASS family bile acid:Na+ symporter
MFGIALSIRFSDFSALRSNKKAIIVGLSAQWLFLPALTFLLVLVLDPPPSVALGMMLVAACPGGVISNFFTHVAGGNAALSVSLSAISTLACFVVTPLNLAFWGSRLPATRQILEAVEISGFEMLQIVAAILLLPVLLGIGTAHFLPRLADVLRVPMRYFSMAVFIVFVIAAVVVNYRIILPSISAIGLLVLLHNSVAFGLGYSLATFARLEPQDIRAISFEAGIQNTALGLILVFSFFDGLGGMALITSVWGIWHIISGSLLAGFWARTDRRAQRAAGVA